MKTSYYDSASYHIYCYFGDTYDVFVDETLLPQTLPELLHRDLKRCGYERVIFFDYNKGAYFLDLESKEMMQGKKAKPAAPAIRSAFKGKLLGGNAGITQPQPKAAQDLSFTLDPAEMIRYAGEFLSDGSVKTAIIFPDGLNMLENMQAGAVLVLQVGALFLDDVQSLVDGGVQHVVEVHDAALAGGQGLALIADHAEVDMLAALVAIPAQQLGNLEQLLEVQVLLVSNDVESL